MSKDKIIDMRSIRDALVFRAIIPLIPPLVMFGAIVVLIIIFES